MGLLWLPFGLTPKPKTGGVRYGDIYARAVAAGVDFFLLFLLLSYPFQHLSQYIYQGFPPEQLAMIQSAQTPSHKLVAMWESGLVTLWLINAGIQILVIGLLMVSAQIGFGNTPGKWLLGLKIVRAKTLEPVAPWRFILRFFAYIPSAMPLMLGVFWASFNKERRAWHDYIAGTAVIHTRPEGWYWQQAKRLFRKAIGKTDAPAAE